MSTGRMRTKIRRKQTAKGVRWYVSILDEDGTEHARGGYATKRAATTAAAALLTDAERVGLVPTTTTTLADYLLGEWLSSSAVANLSVTTRDTYRTTIEKWIVPHIGGLPLQKARARDLDRLYKTLADHGGRGGRKLRGKTVRNVHVLLSKALGDAVRRGYLVANPVLAVDPPGRDDSVERAAWMPEDVRTFLEVASSDRLAGIWRLALATGLRRGELLGLTWDDLDLDEGTVRVQRQVLVRPRAVAGERRVFVRETTKTRRVRIVRFDPATAEGLRKWKAVQGVERLKMGPAWKTDGALGVEGAWVVTDGDGSVVQPDTILGRWRRLVKAAKVPAIPLHGARHSYATIALEAGVRLDVVSAQLGHSNVATTANVYAHISPAAAQEAAERIGKILEGGRA
jgi:integrase